MKVNGIWIDYRNKEQVKWWNNVARKLVSVVRYHEIVETATGKPVGRLIMLKGPGKYYVFKRNLKFIDKPVTGVINTVDR